MVRKYEIYHRETGSLGQHDDYWTLVVPESGGPRVRHDQAIGNWYRGEVKRSSEEVPLKQFLATSRGTAHDKLTALLRELRIDPNI